MKKTRFILGCLLLGLTLTGCNNKSVDTYASISNENESLTINKGESLTVGKVYDYIRKNNDLAISENILKLMIKEQLDFENDDIKNLYNKYLNEYFKTNFVDEGSYNYNGEFNEELLVKYLKSEAYDIKCGTGYNSGALDSKYFTCDYSDYIEKEVNYDAYLKILKVDYIIQNKSSYIDKKEGRKINYYSIKKDSSNTYSAREELEKNVNDILKNQNSTDEDAIKTLKDIADAKIKEELDKIEEEVKKISINDSSFDMLNKYTKCDDSGNKKCTIEEGEKYQKQLILNKLDKEYYVTKVVTKDDTNVLFETARNALFSKNLEDYLYQIGDEKYLVSPVYGDSGERSINDIILYDNSSYYYLVTVEEINSQSSYNDQVLVAELLVDSISNADVFDHYFDKSEIKIYDKQIREYFISNYGEYEGE